MRLPPPVQRLLQELEARGRDHDGQTVDRTQKRLNLERPTAELLHAFVLGSRRRRVLEIGTSNGYSAIWLGLALCSVPDAHPLLTIEREAAKVQEARANVVRAGLAGWVEVLEGAATPVVEGLPGPFDAVFFDADRVSAPEQLERLLPKLTPDAVLFADNALSHPEEIAGYAEAVDRLDDFTTVTIPVGKGLHIAVRVSPASRLPEGV